MTTIIDQVLFGHLMLCFFNPGFGLLAITSSTFECGQTASIVCSRTSSTVADIMWLINSVPTRICTLTFCQFPIENNYNFTADGGENNYNFTADGGVWTFTIDPVELKDNNITFACDTHSLGSDAPVRVSRTIDVSVPIDNSSTLTERETATDVLLTTASNCVKPVWNVNIKWQPVWNVNIKWQCVKAGQVNVIDSDCRLTSLPTYTSECRDLNQACAGPGTYRMGKDVKLPAYKGNYFKLVKIKAVFTDGTKVIEKISGEVKQEEPPTIKPLKNCSAIENSDLSINCILSSGDPSTVKCTWIAPSGTISNNCTLRIPRVQRTSSGTYTCHIENSVGNDTKSFYLDIMYPPEIPVLKIVDTDVTDLTANVLKDTVVTIRCSSSAKPNTLSYTWESAEGSVNSLLEIIDTSSPFTRTYTCTVTNYMNQTCGDNGAQGSNSSRVNVHVVYAPSVYTFKRQRIIEGSSFTQICNTAPGRPIETNYLWTRRNGQLSENKRNLTITNVTPEHADNYTCTAWNILNPSYGITPNGTDQNTFSLEILYSPKLKAIPNQSVMEGSSFTQNYELLRPGNPPGKIMWFSLDQAGNEIPIGSVNGTVTIANVSRNHQGSFKCVTENIMDPTDNAMVRGTDFKIFYLSVFYKTIISSLTIDETENRLVVSQNKANVLLKCYVSSNPLSEISLRSTTHSGSRILLENPSSDHLFYSLSTATCWDSGIYTCSGRNNVTENKVSKAVILLVECTARPLHKVEPIITIYRGVGSDVTLNLTVVAYPLPASELFQWSRLEKEDSTTYLNGSIENLSASSLDSKLSLTNIQDADFGQYKLTIKYNDIVNAYVQYFSIQPQAEADTRSQNNGAIIGGAVGGGAAVMGVVIVVVVFLRRKSTAKSKRSTDSQSRKANEHIPGVSTTGTQEHNEANEYYNLSSNTYEEIRTCSTSGPYADLNRRPGNNLEYSTLQRMNDDNTTTPLPTLGTYENLRLTALK